MGVRVATGGGRTRGIEPRLDHLVYATHDLAATVARFTDVTGVTPVVGGRHPDWATRNMLVRFGQTSYLEIIGPDPDHPAPDAASMPFGLDALTRPRLATWAVRPDDIVSAAAASAAAGADLGPVTAMQRRRADGTTLTWRLALPHRLVLGGIAPFLIEWGSTPHPADDDLPQVRLLQLHASTPEPGTLRHVLKALGVQLDVSMGPPRLFAQIGSPRGTFWLGDDV